MSTPAPKPRPFYDHPRFLAFVPALVVGLVLLTIEDLAWWVPVVVFVGLVVLAGLGLLAWRGLRRARGWRDHYRQLQADHRALKSHVDTLEQRLARHVLFEIIWEAEDKGWRVAAINNAIEFTSPEDEVAFIAYSELNWYTVSQELANTSPHHWDEGWMPPALAQGGGNALHAFHIETDLKELATIVSRIDDRTDPEKVAVRREQIKQLLDRNPDFGKKRPDPG